MGPVFPAKRRPVSGTASPGPLPALARLLSLAALGNSSGHSPGKWLMTKIQAEGAHRRDA